MDKFSTQFISLNEDERNGIRRIIAFLMLQKIHSLLKTDSYSGHLDILYFADQIIQKKPVIAGRQKKIIHDRIMEYIERCGLLLRRFSDMSKDRKGSVLLSRISEIKTGAELFGRRLNTADTNIYHEAVSFLDESRSEISAIRYELNRINRRRFMVLFLASLMKSGLVLQAMNLMAGFLLFPLVEDMLPSTGRVGAGQAEFLIFGAIAGIIMAIVYSIVRFYFTMSKD